MKAVCDLASIRRDHDSVHSRHSCQISRYNLGTKLFLACGHFDLEYLRPRRNILETCYVKEMTIHAEGECAFSRFGPQQRSACTII